LAVASASAKKHFQWLRSRFAPYLPVVIIRGAVFRAEPLGRRKWLLTEFLGWAGTGSSFVLTPRHVFMLHRVPRLNLKRRETLKKFVTRSKVVVVGGEEVF